MADANPELTPSGQDLLSPELMQEFPRLHDHHHFTILLPTASEQALGRVGHLTVILYFPKNRWASNESCMYFLMQRNSQGDHQVVPASNGPK